MVHPVKECYVFFLLSVNIFADVTKGYPYITTSGGNGNKGQDGQDGKKGVDRDKKVWKFRKRVLETLKIYIQLHHKQNSFTVSCVT